MKAPRIKALIINTRTTCLFSLIMALFLVFHAEPTNALQVDFYDNFGYGTNVYPTDNNGNARGGDAYDKVSWIEDSCTMSSNTQYMIMGVIGNNYDVGAYCVNTDRNSDTDYDICLIKNSSWESNCSGVSFPAPTVRVDMSGSYWAYADTVDLYTDTPICDGEAGNTMLFTTKQLKRASINYYCKTPANPTCHDCGTSSNDATGDYYFIDLMRNLCGSNGASEFLLQGRYTTSSYLNIDSVACNMWGAGMVCDDDHDGATSSDAETLPTNPCRLAHGYVCTSSADCWSNAVCSGANTLYEGECAGDVITMFTNPYENTCGGDGQIGTITHTHDNNCVVNYGFPTGYICDPSYNNIEQSSESLVADLMCKGGSGAVCSVDSDCFTDFKCLTGHCGMQGYSVFSTNLSENKVYANSNIVFDPTLSGSSDNNIQYACWTKAGVNVKCNGNSSQCSSMCSGASFGVSNWAVTYTAHFDNGGVYNMSLSTGSVGKYASGYAENYCVSGGGHYCWTCSDGLMNDDESDVDWGGHCGTPTFLRCNNNFKDYATDEVDVDYGGLCGACLNNSNKSVDDDWLFLKEAQLIKYPFNVSQCPESQETQGFIVSFVIFLSALLIIPVLLVLVGGVIVTGVSGFNLISLIFLVFSERKYIKLLNRDLTRLERRVLSVLKRDNEIPISKVANKLKVSKNALETGLKDLIDKNIVLIEEDTLILRK